MKKAITKAPGLGRFEVKCPVCKKVTKRPPWSLAHLDIKQVFTCECGERLMVPPERRARA